MPFDSSGVYSVLIDFSTEATTPPIPIADLDAQFADVGTALSNCILRDGTGVPTAAIPFGGQDVTGMNSLTITQALADTNALILSKAGSKIALGRSSDGSATLIIGSDSIGGSGMSLQQSGGTHSELQLMGTGILNFLTNDIIRMLVNAAGGLSIKSPTTGQALIVAVDNAIQSGGNLKTGLGFTSTANFGIYAGSDAPTISAAKGSLYLRSNATTNVTRAYIATDAVGTWTALNTVA